VQTLHLVSVKPCPETSLILNLPQAMDRFSNFYSFGSSVPLQSTLLRAWACCQAIVDVGCSSESASHIRSAGARHSLWHKLAISKPSLSLGRNQSGVNLDWCRNRLISLMNRSPHFASASVNTQFFFLLSHSKGFPRTPSVTLKHLHRPCKVSLECRTQCTCPMLLVL
jgi:hypothetical protein